MRAKSHFSCCLACPSVFTGPCSWLLCYQDYKTIIALNLEKLRHTGRISFAVIWRYLKNNIFSEGLFSFSSDSAAGLQENTEEGCLNLTKQIKLFPSIKIFQNLNISTLRKWLKIGIHLFFHAALSNCEWNSLLNINMQILRVIQPGRDEEERRVLFLPL